MTALVMASAMTFGSMACPHYGLVPKGFDANLAFKKEIR